MNISNKVVFFYTALATSATPGVLCFSLPNRSSNNAIHSVQQSGGGTPTFINMHRTSMNSRTRLYDSASDNEKDNEIERLKLMAAKLRAEAASLEAEKAEAYARAAENAFRQFDTNEDGEVSLKELKTGLEKILKTELSDKRVEGLMKEFDESGDGALQLEEFVTVDRFRNALEQLAREEKELARELAKQAEKDAAEAALAEARQNFLNESTPTNRDKLISCLPYLFPLMDGLQYGRFLLSAEGAESNPAVVILALLYTLYRSIPFSGFAAFLALNFLSNNPRLNRLVRFNMQQAIFVDIALILPGILSGIGQVALGALSPEAKELFPSELFSDAIFFTLLISLAYCSISSLLGYTPDKLPVISQYVSDRMPTIDMFDDEGRFVPRQFQENSEDKDESKKDDQDKK